MFYQAFEANSNKTFVLNRSWLQHPDLQHDHIQHGTHGENDGRRQKWEEAGVYTEKRRRTMTEEWYRRRGSAVTVDIDWGQER